MQEFNVSDLIPHPQNEFYFDEMTGQKWTEFLESVKTSGVIEPPVVTDKRVIVSGHQRVRACKELGIESLNCEVRIYDSEDRVLKDLIETNIRQRGTIAGSELKMGRIIETLKRIYGIKENGGREPAHSDPVKTSEELASDLCMSKAAMNRRERLLDMIPEFQDALESGTINAKTGYAVIAKLSEEEQLQLLQSLPAAQKFTQSQVQQYIDKIRGLEDNNAALEEASASALQEAVESTRAANSATDSREYLRIKERLAAAEEGRREYYEKWQAAKKKDKTEEVVTEATNKVKAEYRKLVDEQEKKIEELEAAIAEQKSDIDSDRLSQTARVIHMDKSVEEASLDFFHYMQNSTSSFLSDMEGFALQTEFYSAFSSDKKATIAETLRTIMNRCAEIIDYIKTTKEVA